VQHEIALGGGEPQPEPHLGSSGGSPPAADDLAVDDHHVPHQGIERSLAEALDER
jgi:hypothetical protein